MPLSSGGGAVSYKKDVSSNSDKKPIYIHRCLVMYERKSTNGRNAKGGAAFRQALACPGRANGPDGGPSGRKRRPAFGIAPICAFILTAIYLVFLSRRQVGQEFRKKHTNL